MSRTIGDRLVYSFPKKSSVLHPIVAAAFAATALAAAGCQGPDEHAAAALQEAVSPGTEAGSPATAPTHRDARLTHQRAAMPDGLRHAVARLRQREAGERFRVRAAAGAYLAENPDHHMEIRFDDGAVAARARDGGWSVGLRLARWGLRGAEANASSAQVQAERNRVSFLRSGGMEEWYLNGPGGLEQGFNISTRPPAAGARGGKLVLELAVTGDVEPRLGEDGAEVTFHDLQGQAVAVYRDLWVQDAQGTVLGSRMSLERGHLVIEVDDEQAAYPLVVDPMLMGVINKVTATDGSPTDYFGWSVSIDGNEALIGAYLDDDRGTDSGSVYIFGRSGSTWLQQQKITASDGAAGDYFGYAVSLSGMEAIVGAYANSDKGALTGSAYIFTRGVSTWSQQAKVLATDGAAGDQFGFAVSVSSGTALVSSYLDDDRGANSGSAYVFARSGNTWTQQQKLTATDGAATDYFGYGVAVSGNVALVGAYAEDARGSESGSAYIFDRSGSAWTQRQKSTASDCQATDYFGIAVSVSPDEALVGANAEDTKGINSGSAYIFARSGSTWSQRQKITATDGQESDRFGTSVSLSVEEALVGAYAEDARAGNAGAAYVYRRSGTVWSQQKKLTADDGAGTDYFGQAVAVSGGVSLVGAYLDDDKGSNSGSAYFNQLCLTVTETKLTASDGAASDVFGYAVAVNGDTAIIGAFQDDDKGASSGSAYVYLRTGSAWGQQQKLVASDGQASDYFGSAVAINGETALVGAYGEDTRGSNAGAAYVFTRAGSTWTQQAKLTASDGVASDNYGNAVALSGDRALVGSYLEDARGSASGSAYMYQRTGNTWSQLQKITASDGAATDYFGWSVSLDGDTALIGAYLDDDRGVNSGSAYVFVRSGNTWTTQRKLTAADGAASDYFGYSVSLSGELALVGSYLDDDRGGNSGSAYVYSRSGTVWSPQSKITAQDGATSDYFGFSVALNGDLALIGSYMDDDNGGGSGSAYFYRRSGNSWVLQQKHLASTGASSDYFGYSVSLSGDVLLAGAYLDDDLGSASGTAFVLSPTCMNQVGSKCSANTDCASGYCVDGVCCGSACGGGVTDCQACSVQAGADKDGLCGPVNSGYTCRASSGDCDLAENCNGLSTSCPADTLRPSGYTCRASNGDCDVAEVCTGSSKACPTDIRRPSGYLCRASSGDCDQAETCTGTSDTCPADSVLSSGTTCRAASGDCDLAETCNGSSKTCPSDSMRPSGYTCRAANGACDAAEACTGGSKACPADTVLPSTSLCRVASGDCDAAESCDGINKSCPSDTLLPSGTVCRAANGACDVAESCSGSSASCPADSVRNPGYTCRASAGDCDVAESCDGSSKSCPMDSLQPSGTTCRTAGGACDMAESCTGNTAACPPDGVMPSTTVCRTANGDCDASESCDGSNKACPNDSLSPSGTICRAASGACDAVETCTGSTATCPPDGVRASGYTCRAAAGDCDVAESCNGSSKSCPADGYLAFGAVCRAAAGTCDAVETCSGVAPSCPMDQFFPSGYSCRPAVGECDLKEVCSGQAAACPANLFMPNGTPCNTGYGSCLAGLCGAIPDGGLVDAGMDGQVDGASGADLAQGNEAGSGADATPSAEAGSGSDSATGLEAGLIPDMATGMEAGSSADLATGKEAGPKPDKSASADSSSSADKSGGDAVSGKEAGGDSKTSSDGVKPADGKGADFMFTPPGDESGCDCQVSGQPDPAGLLTLLLGLVLLGRRRRGR